MSKEKLIDLDQEQLDLLHAILKQHIPNKTIWAYGSRVTWKAEETSDLDLAVFDCDSMEIYDLKEALEESDLLISVDVMDWESIPGEFQGEYRGEVYCGAGGSEQAGGVEGGEVGGGSRGKSKRDNPERYRSAKSLNGFSGSSHKTNPSIYC